MGLFSGAKHLVGGFTGATAAHAAKDAARAQEEAMRQAMAQFNTDYGAQKDLWNPYVNTGTQGLANLNALNSGDYSAFNSSPDYQYALQQGLRGVNSQAASMGNLFSGSRATALNQKAQGLASQNLGQWRNALMGQIGLGMQGTGALSNQLWNKTQGITNAQLGIGDAQAGGKIGAANSWGQGASNLLNLGTAIYGAGGFGGSGYQPSSGYQSMMPSPMPSYNGTFGSY